MSRVGNAIRKKKKILKVENLDTEKKLSLFLHGRIAYLETEQNQLQNSFRI